MASDIDGSNELVENNVTGLRFRAGDPHQLAARISLLCDNPVLRTSLGQNARRYLLDQNLTWLSTGLQYANLYQQMLNRS